MDLQVLYLASLRSISCMFWDSASVPGAMCMYLEVVELEVETGCGVTEVEAGEVGEVKWN